MFGKNTVVGRKHFEDEHRLLVTSIFVTLQGEGPFSGMPAVFVRLAKCQLSCSFCFVPSTPILMGDGSEKRIDAVQTGDEVMSWTGTGFEPRRVTKTYRSIAGGKRLLRVDVPNRKVWCTPEHPFLVSGKGWVQARDLRPGDKLVHWDVHNRMRMFNPREYAGPISAEARERLSQSMIELWDRPGFKRRHIARMRANNPMANPEVAQRAYLSREDRGKTGLEQKFHKICEDLPISYCGDGQDFSIAHRMPDFKVDGQQKVIEVWASDAQWAKYRDDQWMAKRRALFAAHGYDTLFMPLTQLETRSDNHDHIRDRVAEFVHNGAVVKSVTEVISKRALARLYGSANSLPLVYNLEVEGSHTYVANSLVVHNCDTYFDRGDWYEPEQLSSSILDVLRNRFGKLPEVYRYYDDLSTKQKRKMVLVITGGEPTLQWRALKPFMQKMSQEFEYVQLETNGLLLREDAGDAMMPYLVVSPKCAEVDGRPTHYLKPAKAMLELADCLKFVMSADPGSPYNIIPIWALEWRSATGKEVFVSPMNIYKRLPKKVSALETGGHDAAIRAEAEVISFWEEGLLDMEKNQANHEYAARYCITNGLRLSIQQHLYASLA